MRIGVFIPAGSSPTNGQGMYQQGMLDGLFAQSRHQAVVLMSDADEPPDVPPPHELVRIPQPRRRLFSALGVDLFAEGAAAAAARRARVDVIVGNAQFSMPRPRGVARIAVLFESAFAEPSPWAMYPALTQRQWIATTKRNLRGARAVICLTHHGRAETTRTFGVPTDRIEVAPPSLQPFPALARSRYRPEGHYVLVVGWFHPRRDVMLALAAWRAAAEQGLDRDLVLAGAEGPIDRRNGSLARRILDSVGHDLARRVHFTGPVPRAELGALYRHASTLLMTSRHEGFGIPAIEAFSMGVPVVAADRTSLREVVDPAGVVVAPEPDALGHALVDACRNPGDAAARRAYAATFTPERQVQPILEVADRLSGYSAG